MFKHRNKKVGNENLNSERMSESYLNLISTAFLASSSSAVAFQFSLSDINTIMVAVPLMAVVAAVIFYKIVESAGKNKYFYFSNVVSGLFLFGGGLAIAVSITTANFLLLSNGLSLMLCFLTLFSKSGFK